MGKRVAEWHRGAGKPKRALGAYFSLNRRPPTPAFTSRPGDEVLGAALGDQ
jgi:hypothetical protein